MSTVCSQTTNMGTDNVSSARTQSKVRERIEKRSSFGLTVKHLITICSTVVIPLGFGLFTVIITIYQQRIAQLQRAQDLEIAQKQRAHDIELTQQQRNEDRKQAELLRKQDLEIAEARRIQELNISVSQAVAADLQHKHDLLLAGNLQKESVLVGYLKEMADLLNAKSFNLTKEIRTSIVRPKTLSALRESDAARKTHLIRFLYESELIITSNNPLDLSDVDLDGIDLSFLNLFSVSLKSVHMRHARLIGTNLSFVDFSKTLLTGTNFSSAAMMISMKFCMAQAENCDFSHIESVKLHMNGITATGSSSRSASLNQAKFQWAHLDNVDFEDVSVVNADFYFANLENSTITEAQLQQALAHEEIIMPNFNISGYKNVIRNGYAEIHTEQSQYSVNIRQPVFASIWDRIDGE